MSPVGEQQLPRFFLQEPFVNEWLNIYSLKFSLRENRFPMR
jgi:hypothetical protein